jgi:CRP-like cAMP-binding protein
MEQNHLLRLLPEDVRQRLFPKLELTALPFGHVLYEAAVAQRCVFFPTDCVISLLYVMEDGASAEIAIVGNEGVVNVALFMGGETTSNRAIVQNGGHALRLEGQILRDEFRRSGALRHRFLRYTQALLTQMAQTAVCNRYHTADQQLSRWLLMSLDRLPTNRLTMTQELIANMLGVRREGVTEAAGKLEAQGIIHYKRGQIIVLDRPKLEEASCECYRAVRREAARLLSDHVP